MDSQTESEAEANLGFFMVGQPFTAKIPVRTGARMAVRIAAVTENSLSSRRTTMPRQCPSRALVRSTLPCCFLP